LLVAGLPGSGKSTLARALAQRANFHVIRSDVVRKELAEDSGKDIYTPEWSDRTYAECLRRAEELLFAGGRVLVDANFRQEHRRRSFLEMARAWGVPGGMLVCQVPPHVARQRLEKRTGDVSDANWQVYQELTGEWEAPGPATVPFLRTVATEGPGDQTLARALAVLREWGLCG
jgi:predicted kinase